MCRLPNPSVEACSVVGFNMPPKSLVRRRDFSPSPQNLLPHPELKYLTQEDDLHHIITSVLTIRFIATKEIQERLLVCEGVHPQNGK